MEFMRVLTAVETKQGTTMEEVVDEPASRTRKRKRRTMGLQSQPN